MKLYAYSTPEIPGNDGFLKIGETNGIVEQRVRQQGHELGVNHLIVWQDVVITDRIGIDKMVHRYLKGSGFDVKKFEESGRDTELVRCTVADLEKAFATIKEQLYQDEIKRQELCNKFYLELRNWYYWATDKFPDPEVALRLIIRLLFCYFLKEKELVPHELLDESFIREHLKINEEYRYYNAVLRNLFFHCLNSSVAERREIEHKELIKHQSIRFVKEQFDKIPFLNGGLFNEQAGDEVPLSNDYFFSEEQTRHLPELDGKYKVAGIVRILSQYYYKLTLDDLIDREEYVETIDPEFIGKVFESLLACIDADSKATRRKVTGSYYTPREVVDYMVSESLDAYLESHDDILECKILDPACGSGAFPCGIMNEVMRRIDPDRTLTQSERYRRKLEVLRKVIYGVDIQPIAVQISQLRLFLSLIQEIVPTKRKQENYGIEPLPNLETRFVCADTLIGLKKKEKNGQRRLEMPIVQEAIKQLQRTRSRYFMASTVREKEAFRQDDESQRKMLGIVMEDTGVFTHDVAEKLLAWNPYNQFISSPFFDSVWMFGLEKFDIIIANPPYIQLQKTGGKLAKKYEHCCFETFVRTGDIYLLFYEKGWQLLKEGGHLCFVTSNKWMRTNYGKSLRKFLSENTNPMKLLDLAGIKVFESATVDVNILLFAKEMNQHRTSTRVLQSIAELKTKKKSKLKTMSFSSSPWVIISPIEQRIWKKVKSTGVPLKDWSIQINFGIKTGYNEAFIIDETKKKELIDADPKSAEIIQPILRGRDIQKYGANFAGFWLINTHNGVKEKGIKPIKIDDYPAIKNHLDSHWDKIENRADQGVTPYNLRNCAYLEDFSKPKIIFQEIVQEPSFMFDQDASFFCLDTGRIITGDNIKLLLPILNSKLFFYAIKHFYGGGGLGKSGVRMKHTFFERFCCPTFDSKKDMHQLKPIITLVNKIISAKKTNPAAKTTKWERQIDALVYELYGLTDKEIAVVEG